MNSQSKSQYLDILQVYRGIAAMMVVLHHTIGSLRVYHKIEQPFLTQIAFVGKFGVDFFFVLSGFIIAYSAYYKYNDRHSFSNYIKNRLLRIYIPYLPIGIFMLALYTFLPEFSNGNRTISALTSISLLPHGNPALSVAWTLSFELCFYLLFGISFISKRIWNGFLLVWFLAIILFTYSPYSSSAILKNPFFRLLFSPYNFEFILGFMLAIVFIRKIKINLILVILVLIVSLVPFFYCIFNHLNFFPFDLNMFFATGMFMMLYVAINCNYKLNPNALLMMIGNATYSIYLIHNPLQMILIRFHPTITSIAGLILALIVVLVVCCAFGYVYYLVFEKKAIQALKSKLIN